MGTSVGTIGIKFTSKTIICAAAPLVSREELWYNTEKSYIDERSIV